MDIDLLTVAQSRDGPMTIGGVCLKKEGKKEAAGKRRKSEQEKEAKKGRARVGNTFATLHVN